MTWGRRWEWKRNRQNTGGLLSLDVRALKLAGALAQHRARGGVTVRGITEPAQIRPALDQVTGKVLGAERNDREMLHQGTFSVSRS